MAIVSLLATIDIENGNIRMLFGDKFHRFPSIATSATTLKSGC